VSRPCGLVARRLWTLNEIVWPIVPTGTSRFALSDEFLLCRVFRDDRTTRRATISHRSDGGAVVWARFGSGRWREQRRLGVPAERQIQAPDQPVRRWHRRLCPWPVLTRSWSWSLQILPDRSRGR